MDLKRRDLREQVLNEAELLVKYHLSSDTVVPFSNANMLRALVCTCTHACVPGVTDSCSAVLSHTLLRHALGAGAMP